MKALKYLLFFGLVGIVIGGCILLFFKAGPTASVNHVEGRSESNRTSKTEANVGREVIRTSRSDTANVRSIMTTVSSQISTAAATQDVFVRNKSVKVEPMKDMSAFINRARSVLEKRNVPIGERIPQTRIENGEVIVTFPPKRGERAGSFIVRINRETGEIIDTKIWR